jgi:hypothetical protein
MPPGTEDSSPKQEIDKPLGVKYLEIKIHGRKAIRLGGEGSPT